MASSRILLICTVQSQSSLEVMAVIQPAKSHAPHQQLGSPRLWLWHRPWGTPALQQRWPEAGPHVQAHQSALVPWQTQLHKVFTQSPLLSGSEALQQYTVNRNRKSEAEEHTLFVTDNKVLHTKPFKCAWVSWSSQESLSRGRRISHRTALWTSHCPFTFPSWLY